MDELKELKRNGSGYVDPTAYKAIKNYIGGVGTMEMKRGEIFEYNMKNGEIRYALIISSDERRADRVLTVVMLADEPKGRITVPVVCKTQMYADCCMISYAFRDGFGNYVRSATEQEMHEIDLSILEALGFDVSEGVEYKASGKPMIDELVDSMTNKLTEVEAERDFLRKQLKQIEAGTSNANEETMKLTVERNFYKEQYEKLFEKMIAR